MNVLFFAVFCLKGSKFLPGNSLATEVPVGRQYHSFLRVFHSCVLEGRAIASENDGFKMNTFFPKFSMIFTFKRLNFKFL